MKTSSGWIVSEIQWRQKQRDGELKHKGKNLQECFTSNKYNITVPVTCQVVSLFDEESVFGQLTTHGHVVKYLFKVPFP